ncbi:MAG: hypothetical protein E6Q88_14040 [Lysobacteraceae bacterium]|nr:MAG: hypothetical protein E6Q88_14040 [Xanthomonadaceae bacterium]
MAVVFLSLGHIETTQAQTGAGRLRRDADALADSVRIARAAGTELRIEVAGVDDAVRLAMLQRWAEEAARATVVDGRFPLREARVWINEIDSRDRSPVPWGQTSRRGLPSVLLYVRRGASYEELRADWTAVHEFSHLFHPYLDDEGRWMAEGLASYFQNVLRAQMGVLDADEAWRRLDAGFRRGETARSEGRLDAVSRDRGGTMRVYWAGAAYWLEMDLALRHAHDSSLIEVLGRYAHCCLDGNAYVAPSDWVVELDRIVGASVFLPAYRRYAAMQRFPSLDASYRALGIERADAGLRFSDRGEGAALRAAIMGKLEKAASR